MVRPYRLNAVSLGIRDMEGLVLSLYPVFYFGSLRKRLEELIEVRNVSCSQCTLGATEPDREIGKPLKYIIFEGEDVIIIAGEVDFRQVEHLDRRMREAL